MIFDLIALSILTLMIAFLLITNFKTRSSNKRLSISVLQLTLDKSSLLKHIEKISEESQSNNIEQTEGFIKFVSQSRDWAFDYIEEVQAGLINFSNKVDVDIKYILKYGTLIEHPLQESINRIAEAYTELEKLLPQDKDQV
jgi:hypothetical protein